LSQVNGGAISTAERGCSHSRSNHKRWSMATMMQNIFPAKRPHA
jgi:hypothetical protein